MRKNILVAKFNRVEIVFTDMMKINKLTGEKIAIFHSVIKKKIHEGKVFYPADMDFKNSFDILYNQLVKNNADIYLSLRENLAVKYHEGVL